MVCGPMLRCPFTNEEGVGRGLHSSTSQLNLSSLCSFPLNLSLLCPPCNPKLTPGCVPKVLKLSSNVSDVFPKVLKLSSEVSLCKPLGFGDAADSYAYDGHRVRKWNVSCQPYGQAWVAGDVITCCIDLSPGPHGRVLHSSTFRLNLSSVVHRVTRLNS